MAAPRLSRLAGIFTGICMLMPAAGSAGPDRLSDAEKKAAVYRMYEGYKKNFPKVIDISPKDAMVLSHHGKAVFIDARRPAEISVSKIAGAVNVDSFIHHPEKYAGKTAIAYCTISYRSGMLAQKWAEKDIHIKNLRGGILAWTLEGGTIVDPGGRPVRKLHVYGEKWNFPPSGYTAVMFGWLERLF